MVGEVLTDRRWVAAAGFRCGLGAGATLEREELRPVDVLGEACGEADSEAGEAAAAAEMDIVVLSAACCGAALCGASRSCSPYESSEEWLLE